MAGTEGEARVPVVELRCPNCGAPCTLRGFQTTRTRVCDSCGATIDTSGEAWQLVETVERAYRGKPCYALGTRGKLEGITWEVIGWQRRVVRSGGEWRWEELLLYNPYEGFRYLLHQDGHFALVEPLAGLPSTGTNRAAYRGTTYRHFSSGKAVVEQVLGEFPWEVRKGDVALASDYVAPPLILSSEESQGELVWSWGRYLERAELEAAFGKPTGEVRAPRGIYPCQPNPNAQKLRWTSSLMLLALIVWALFSGFYLLGRENRLVWSGQIPAQGGSAELALDTRTQLGNLEFSARAEVDNNWVWVPMLLVGPLEQGEQARAVDLEVSYYHGSDSDGSWSEGSRESRAVIDRVPNGRYLLQVEPRQTDSGRPYQGLVNLELRRDVRLWRYPLVSLLLILAFPIALGIRHGVFEQRRWQESDHA